MKRDLSPCHRPHGISCLFWNYAQGCGRKSPVGNLLFWRRTEYLQQVRRHPRMRLQVASGFMREGLLENHHDPARIDQVPLYAPIPKPSGIAQEPGLLFLPSRLVPPKGVQVALQAVARLRHHDWRLVIAGDGWHRGALENLSRSLGLQDRVQFIGEVSPDDVASWYDRCELVLFPVLRLEPFGLVGAEAMSHGRALVGFGGGGADEWFRDGEAAVRVPDRTPEALATALEGLLSNRARIQQLAAGARRHYPHFHPDAYLQRLLGSFENAIRDFRDARH
jgi:glycosyltransferase involved in cell wall biosynthesis